MRGSAHSTHTPLSEQSLWVRHSLAQPSFVEVAPIEATSFIADISSDGSELLALAAGPADNSFFSLPLPAGSPRRLGDIIGHYAVWAPNGRLLFAKGDDLYLAEHDGTAPRKLVTAPDRPQHMHFSPDGTRFRFNVLNSVSGNQTIWEANADGSSMHPLLPGWNNPPNECCGSCHGTGFWNEWCSRWYQYLLTNNL
jgi:hypothetical protein